MKQIALTQGKFALVDDEDYEYLNQFKWYAHKKKNTYYAKRELWINKKNVVLPMHKAILNPEIGQVCDHIDGDGLNNQRSNLRLCIKAENCRNQRIRTGTSSKFKGVSFQPSRNKWTAYITIDYKRISLGRFLSEEDAAKAYDAKAKVLHGEFANVNFK